LEDALALTKAALDLAEARLTKTTLDLVSTRKSRDSYATMCSILKRIKGKDEGRLIVAMDNAAAKRQRCGTSL
jgi:hypothetical protein